MTPRRRILFGAQAFEQAQLNAFKTRVQAGSGSIEAEACLRAEIKRLQDLGLYDKASLIVTPNAYKAAKIYSLKPTSGAGDLTFARAGTKFRRNASGNLVQIANNVPPLHYPFGGSCPAWLNEPQSTNQLVQSFLRATWSGVSGAVLTPNQSASCFDGELAAEITYPSAAYPFARLGNQSILNNTTYTLSCYFKNVDFAPGDIVRLLINNNASPGFSITAFVNVAAKTATFSIGGTSGTGFVGTATGRITLERDDWFRVEVTGTTGTAAASNICSIEIVSVNKAGKVLVCVPQLEVGAVATSPIINAATALTRIADVSNTTGLSLLIGQTEGTFAAAFYLYPLGLTNGIISLGDGGFTNFIMARVAPSNRIQIEATGGVNILESNVRTEGWIGLVVKYGSFGVRVFANGVQIGSTATIPTPASLSVLRYGSSPFGNTEAKLLRPGAVYMTALSDAECLALSNSIQL